MNYLMKLLFCFFILYSQPGFTADPVISNCVETPEIHDVDNKPHEFAKSNNLMRKPGSALPAKGKLMYIRGKVTDINCVPIQNASVFMWHTNAYGFYQTDHEDNKGLKVAGYIHDDNFSGSGQSITDNLGNYSFVTITPEQYDNRVPHINFMVQYPDFIEFTTSMFFENNNNADPQFKGVIDPKLKKSVDPELMSLLIPPYIKDQNGIKTYYFNITIGERSVYRINRYATVQ